MTTPRQPGWYDDPQDPNAQRYWDGDDWTPHRQRKSSSPSVQPTVASPQTQQPPPPAGLPPRTGLPPVPNAPSSPPPPPGMPPPPPPPGSSPAGAGQGDAVPVGPPPQAWPPPSPQPQGAGGQMAAEGLTAMKGLASKLSVTAWLIYGGLALALIATFLPFATESITVLGTTVADEVSTNGLTRFVVLLLVAVAAWSAWPTLSGSPIVVGRLIGLSVVVVLLIGLIALWFTNTSKAEGGDISLTPGFGAMLYGAAVIAVAVGVVRLWTRQPQARNRTS